MDLALGTFIGANKCAAVCLLYSVKVYSSTVLNQSPGCSEAGGKAMVVWEGLPGGDTHSIVMSEVYKAHFVRLTKEPTL